jgi:sodium/hydrogen antiporter
MENVNTHTLAMTLALVGVVIVISALLSGLIERSGLPQVAAFLALGAALGPAGLGAMNLTPSRSTSTKSAVTARSR